jgi:membrane protein insertase Oxa1/YidC/SpoIIIJ
MTCCGAAPSMLPDRAMGWRVLDWFFVDYNIVFWHVLFPFYFTEDGGVILIVTYILRLLLFIITIISRLLLLEYNQKLVEILLLWYKGAYTIM